LQINLLVSMTVSYQFPRHKYSYYTTWHYCRPVLWQTLHQFVCFCVCVCVRACRNACRGFCII